MLLRAFDNTPRFSYSFFSILVFMYFFSLMLGAVLSFSFLHCRQCNRNWSWSTFFSSREVQRNLDSFHRFSITVLSSIAATLEESRCRADNASVKSAKKNHKGSGRQEQKFAPLLFTTIACFCLSSSSSPIHFSELPTFSSPRPLRLPGPYATKSRFVFILIRSRWP
jgi:hypothetical protein